MTLCRTYCASYCQCQVCRFHWEEIGREVKEWFAHDSLTHSFIYWVMEGFGRLNRYERSRESWLELVVEFYKGRLVR